MTTTQVACVVNLPAGADLDDKAFNLLQLNSSGQVVITTTANTDVVVGILWGNPGKTAAGDIVPVALIDAGGILKCKAAEAIEAGAFLLSHGDDGEAGHVAAQGNIPDNGSVFGIALDAAANGDVFRFIAGRMTSPNAA